MDARLRDAERAYSIDKTETNRIAWVTELLRSGALTKPPFGVQMKSDGRAVGSGWQAAKDKWYLIARVEPSCLTPSKQHLAKYGSEAYRTTLCVLTNKAKEGQVDNNKRQKYVDYRKSAGRLRAFTCTPKDLNEMWLGSLVAYRLEDVSTFKSYEAALVDWYQKGGAYLNPGASLMRYSARDYRDLLT